LKEHTILFLAANRGIDPRTLAREARAIQQELKRSGYRDRFQFETRWAAAPLDLLREIRELKPAVVHFSGRGCQAGLYFHAASGRSQAVSSNAIAEAFSAAGASVKLVVLSACYVEATAAALLAHVDCVVGFGGSVHEDAARSFAIGFYGGLGADDMAGNVWEWTRSVETEDAPILRGGGWYQAEINARSVNRSPAEPTLRNVNTGVRVCATPRI
jgi:hypothetical protein